MIRFFFSLIFGLLLVPVSTSVFAEVETGDVGTINIYGTEWGNSWSGGILFTLNNMPSGVTYFTIRKDDLAFNAFLSTLLSVKASGKKISVRYNSSKTDGNGYSAVTSLAIP